MGQGDGWVVPPSAPTSPSATAGNSQVSVSWTASSGATSYNLYFDTNSGFTAPTKISAVTSPYTHSSLTNGTVYYYKIEAVTGTTAGALSSMVNATPAASGTGSWSSVQPTSAPVAREYHSAVWTGSKMIIWGGRVSGGPSNTGALYDPIANSWSATTTTSAPDARMQHTAVWTGARMVIWGGVDGNDTTLNSGSRYDPVADSWSPVTTTSAPSARYLHKAVWSGSLMIVWGGATDTYFNATNTGGRYDPVADSWTSTNTTGAPAQRVSHAAVWTGSKMIVWGGRDGFEVDTGGIYDPSSGATGTWTATSSTNAPSARHTMSAIWTGSKMIIWGGYDGLWTNTGGIFDPTASSGSAWSTLTTTGAPLARSNHIGVWTGSKMLVWGGQTSSGLTDTGAVFDPVAQSWSAMATSGGPSAREDFAGVWTGSKLIVWEAEMAQTLSKDPARFLQAQTKPVRIRGLRQHRLAHLMGESTTAQSGPDQRW